MFCSGCGKNLADDATFCSGCGKATGGGNPSAKTTQGIGVKAKKKFIVVGVVAVVAVVAIVAIVLFLNIGGSPLVGTWVSEGSRWTDTITFRRNNTGEFREYFDGQIDRVLTFRWSADDTILSFVFDGGFREYNPNFTIVDSGRNAFLEIHGGGIRTALHGQYQRR